MRPDTHAEDGYKGNHIECFQVRQVATGFKQFQPRATPGVYKCI
jgi:hypothetical protein